MPQKQVEIVPFKTRMKSFTDQIPESEDVLLSLYEAYRAANEAIIGVLNKPRCSVSHRLLDAAVEDAADRACAIAEKLQSLPAISEDHRDWYVETMVSHAFFVGENVEGVLSEFARACKLRAAA